MDRLVVIGNGMAGVASVEQILRHSPHLEITLFGEGTSGNVVLPVGDDESTAVNDLEWYNRNGITMRLGIRIVDIDSEGKTVTGNDGSITVYDKLLIATGSTAVLPPIAGSSKANVFRLENLAEVDGLPAAVQKGKKAVVVGGGPLGLEAAGSLLARGWDVTVVHSGPTLMERQLDSTGAQYLQRRVESLGVRVLCGKVTTGVLGGSAAEGVGFKDGGELRAEAVVIAARIRPNIDLGRRAGLEVNRGIVVNDFMETSNPDIFAVGECVEHHGVTYGLVAPLAQQARVVASTISGNRNFAEDPRLPNLRVMGVEMFSAGQFEDGSPQVEAIRYEDPSLGVYKKLMLRNGRLAGVILVGDTSDNLRYMDWMRKGTDLTGKRRNLLFPEGGGERLEETPVVREAVERRAHG